MTKAKTKKATDNGADEEPGASQLAEIQALIRSKKLPRMEHQIVRDNALSDELRKARMAVGAAELALKRAEERGEDTANHTAALAEATEKRDTLEAEAEDNVITITFQALPKDELEALLKEHPPDRSHISAYQAEAKRLGKPATDIPMYDPEEFPPRLLAACSLKPKLDLETATELWRSPRFSYAEIGLLWGAVWNLNTILTQ